MRASACAPLLLAAATPTPVALSIGSGADGVAAATARMVGSFIDYARWTQQPNPLVLCLVGSTSHAGQLDRIVQADGRGVVVRGVAPAGVISIGCDVVYFGQLLPELRRQAMVSLRGRGVLTIAEDDPQCRSHAMFCLRQERGGLAFSVNIDSVSRSGLRIDPRVLRIADGTPQ